MSALPVAGATDVDSLKELLLSINSIINNRLDMIDKRLEAIDKKYQSLSNNMCNNSPPKPILLPQLTSSSSSSSGTCRCSETHSIMLNLNSKIDTILNSLQVAIPLSNNNESDMCNMPTGVTVPDVKLAYCSKSYCSDTQDLDDSNISDCVLPSQSTQMYHGPVSSDLSEFELTKSSANSSGGGQQLDHSIGTIEGGGTSSPSTEDCIIIDDMFGDCSTASSTLSQTGQHTMTLTMPCIQSVVHEPSLPDNNVTADSTFQLTNEQRLRVEAILYDCKYDLFEYKQSMALVTLRLSEILFGLETLSVCTLRGKGKLAMLDPIIIQKIRNIVVERFRDRATLFDLEHCWQKKCLQSLAQKCKFLRIRKRHRGSKPLKNIKEIKLTPQFKSD